MTPASNEEGEKTLQGWYKLTKAFFELGDTLKQYLEKEMEKHHNHVKDRNKSTVPCRRCHSSMGRSQCEHCRSWRKIVEESVRKIWDCDNCTDYSCKKCRDRSKLPWRGTKPWDSYEDFKQFTILFTDGRYKDNRLQDIDALGLVLIMEHCKAFEHIDFEHYDELRDFRGLLYHAPKMQLEKSKCTEGIDCMVNLLKAILNVSVDNTNSLKGGITILKELKTKESIEVNEDFLTRALQDLYGHIQRDHIEIVEGQKRIEAIVQNTDVTVTEQHQKMDELVNQMRQLNIGHSNKVSTYILTKEIEYRRAEKKNEIPVWLYWWHSSDTTYISCIKVTGNDGGKRHKKPLPRLAKQSYLLEYAKNHFFKDGVSHPLDPQQRIQEVDCDFTLYVGEGRRREPGQEETLKEMHEKEGGLLVVLYLCSKKKE